MPQAAVTILALAVSLSLAGLAAGPAQAREHSIQGVAAGGAGQSTADYRALQAHFPRASLGLQPAVRCKGAYVWRGFKHPLLGYFYFKYRQRIDWCFNGTKITALLRRRQVDCCVPLWDFKGHIGNRTFGGRGRKSYYAYTQGKFQICAAWCFRTRTPWVSQRVYANGRWRYGHGG
jgi:hypothetical protein